MQNSNQKTQLQKYSAFAVAVLAGGMANSQVVYTDVDPDLVVGINEYIPVDLNGDLIPDFALVNDTTNSMYFGDLIPMGADNSVAGYSADVYAYNFDFLSALDEATVVGPSLDFVGGIGGIMFSSLFPEANGAWVDATNKYAGLKFKIGSETHYGWMLLDAHIETPAQIILKGFAYEQSANTAIIADVPGVAIETNETGSQLFYFSGYLNIVLPVLEENASFNIYDMTGKLIQTEQIFNTNTKHLISGISTGIYLVQVMNGTEMHSETVQIN